MSIYIFMLSTCCHLQRTLTPPGRSGPTGTQRGAPCRGLSDEKCGDPILRLNTRPTWNMEVSCYDCTPTGWWFGTWISDVPIYWECRHLNWRTPSFFRVVGLNHQPANSWMVYFTGNPNQKMVTGGYPHFYDIFISGFNQQTINGLVGKIWCGNHGVFPRPTQWPKFLLHSLDGFHMCTSPTKSMGFWVVFGYLFGGLEPWNFMTLHILGISYSQLTNSYFSDGFKPPTRLLGEGITW